MTEPNDRSRTKEYLQVIRDLYQIFWYGKKLHVQVIYLQNKLKETKYSLSGYREMKKEEMNHIKVDYNKIR